MEGNTNFAGLTQDQEPVCGCDAIAGGMQPSGADSVRPDDLSVAPVLAAHTDFTLPFAKATLTAWRIGEDILVAFAGGTAHIGCSVLATPRPSRTGDGSTSATASVLNVSGHKDDMLCRHIAERICAATKHTVTCTGGFHIDDITPNQIIEVSNEVDNACSRIIAAL